MKVEVIELPYSKKDLEPVLSEEAVNLHYEKHHKGYLDNLKKLIKDTSYEDQDLESIIRDTMEGPIFNNAAQVYNHNLYWESLRPDPEMSSAVVGRIEKYYKSIENFKSTVKSYATKHFGSGWVWICAHEDGSLFVQDSHDAGTPVIDPLITPLLVIDIWEHAYYVDWRNDRAKYIDEIWSIINWDKLA